MTTESCGTCRFSRPDPQDLSVLYCHAHPPSVQIVGIQNGSVSKVTTWPPVPRGEWCGEFAERVADLLKSRTNGNLGNLQ